MPKETEYWVCLENGRGQRSITSFDSREEFERWYTPGLQEKYSLIEQGGTQRSVTQVAALQTFLHPMNDAEFEREIRGPSGRIDPLLLREAIIRHEIMREFILGMNSQKQYFN